MVSCHSSLCLQTEVFTQLSITLNYLAKKVSAAGKLVLWFGIRILVPTELWESGLYTPSVPVSQQREREVLSMTISWALSCCARAVLAAWSGSCYFPRTLWWALFAAPNSYWQFSVLHLAVWLAGSSLGSSGISVCSQTCRVHPGL